ncbi:MAG: hypothetical protein U0704_02495 [Candidatus Eisenbacteria bacterium]
MTRPNGCPADELLTTEPDASLREHLESCARCRARVAQLRAFLEGEAAAGARPLEADARLAAALDREIFAGAEPAGVVRRAAEPARPSFWESLFAPALRPAWAFAVVAIVAGGVWLAVQPERAEVRGDGPGPVAVETFEPVAGAHRVTLSWKPVPNATRYDVVFLADDLSELGSTLHASAPTLTLRGDALPAGLRSGSSVLWIVTARAGEAELSHSVAARVTLP